MERLNQSLRSVEPSHEELASLSSGVVYPEDKKERRRLRLARRVAVLALDALGDSERGRIEHETSVAAEGDLKVWHRRTSYVSTWDELVGARPLEGLAFVSCDRLLQHAIADPLRCWCVLLLFTPSCNEELDYDRVRYGAPWVREAWPTLTGVVEELREHRRALVSCKSERLARGIAATINEKRLGAFIYGPTGEMMGCLNVKGNKERTHA